MREKDEEIGFGTFGFTTPKIRPCFVCGKDTDRKAAAEAGFSVTAEFDFCGTPEFMPCMRTVEYCCCEECKEKAAAIKAAKVAEFFEAIENGFIME